jgi:hypothetical protein
MEEGKWAAVLSPATPAPIMTTSYCINVIVLGVVLGKERMLAGLCTRNLKEKVPKEMV